MQNLANITLDQLAADRFNAAQAARESAQLDPRSVLLVVKSKIAAGRIDEAKDIVAAYRKGTK